MPVRIRGSNTTYRPLPCTFAPYIAMSASRSSSPACPVPASCRATPTLALTRAWRPSMVEQHRELVAAQPGDRVAAADAGLQPLADGDQHRVPGRVAEAVVQRLEPVQVDVEDGEQCSLPRLPGDRVLDPVVEER